MNKSELYYWIVALCSYNSILLIVLLWKEKNRVLFNVDTMLNKLSEIKGKDNTFIKTKF